MSDSDEALTGANGPVIQELLKNNDMPSDDAVREVEGFFEGPIEELKSIDFEIQRLEWCIVELRIRRNQVQETISRYSVILSPIRRVPVDILHDIFYYCLPTHRNSLISATESPLLLTRICSAWRTTALNSPRLWAQIHITFSDGDLSADTLGLPKSERPTEIASNLRLRCKGVEEWLSRSGTCPLAISINYRTYTSSRFWHHTSDNFPQEPHSEITSKLFGILLRFSNLWENISTPQHL